MKALLLAAALAAASAVAFAHEAMVEDTAFGRPADPRKAKRTVAIDMTDEMRFRPGEITVKRGEIVRFVPANKGQVMHEMVLGRLEDLKAHAEAMRAHPGMQHSEPNAAHVAPGKSGELGWHFTKAGEFYYACLVPGHFEAGMMGKVKVTQ